MKDPNPCRAESMVMDMYGMGSIREGTKQVLIREEV